MTDTPADPIAAEARDARAVAGRILDLFWDNFLKSEPAFIMRNVIVIELEKAKSAGRAEASAWRPIAEAPKSLAEGSHVHGVYLLGFVPEEGVVDRASCIQVIWWEPLMPNRRGFKGCWCGEDGEDIQPTRFMPLPPPPEGGER